jgi:hypothetical protein
VSVLSIDLAYRAYREVGVCALNDRDGSVVVEPIRLVERGASGRPSVAALAPLLAALADEHGACLIFIDGPQGWKAPDNGLEFCRVCERELNTPGKTGLPGTTRPQNYLRFIEFSIALFDALSDLGWPRLIDPATLRSDERFALESFPTAAWRSLGLPALPGKRRTTPEVLARSRESLANAFRLECPTDLTHDELTGSRLGPGGDCSGTTKRGGVRRRGQAAAHR